MLCRKNELFPIVEVHYAQTKRSYPNRAILRYNQETNTKKEIEDMCRPFAGILGNQFK